ncbi:MAG: uridine kinase [Arcticibacterium sp.]
MKENLTIQNNYFQLAEEIITSLKIGKSINKLIIGISGESGSGKSITGYCLKSVLEQKNFKVAYLQMDDYFKLSPIENHKNRLLSIQNIGPTEVNLELLESHLQAFKNNIDTSGPEIDFAKNSFDTRTLEFQNIEILLVEGTYIPELQLIDHFIFLDIDYKKSLRQRIERGRERFDPFIEEVLRIEHKIISQYKSQAEIVINAQYQIESYHVKKNETAT